MAFKIVTTVDVEIDKITNALIGVAECGYSPWFGEFEHVAGQRAAGEGLIYADNYFFSDKDFQLKVTFDDPDEEEGRFTGEKVLKHEDFQKGLNIMAAQHPRHFNDLISGNDDAITHDVLIQCVIFGEVIYG